MTSETLSTYRQLEITVMQQDLQQTLPFMEGLGVGSNSILGCGWCVCGGGGGGRGGYNCDRGDMCCMYECLEDKYWGGHGPPVPTPMEGMASSCIDSQFKILLA